MATNSQIVLAIISGILVLPIDRSDNRNQTNFMDETRSRYCKNRRRQNQLDCTTAEWTAKIRRDISTRLLSETINESPPPADQRKSIRVSDSIYGLPLFDEGYNVKEMYDQ